MSVQLKHFLEAILPLPSRETRRRSWLSSKHYDLANDADYLCDFLWRKGALLGLLLLAGMVLDVTTGTNLLISHDRLATNKLLLPLAFTHLARWIAVGASLLVYIRIRLTHDLRTTVIPGIRHDESLLVRTQAQWISSSLLLLAAGLICIFGSHYIVIMLTLHFHRENDVPFIFALMLLQAIGLVGCSFVIPIGLWLLEKAIRFFPELQHDLRRPAALPPATSH